MGFIKRYMEDKTESHCDCEGGCSLSIDEHLFDCPAKGYLEHPEDTNYEE